MKPKIYIALFAVVSIGVLVFTFLYNIPDKKRSSRTTRPDIGLGYHGPNVPYTPGTGIKNSPHDLSKSSSYYPSKPYNPEGETNTCIFCHIANEAHDFSPTTDIPLWNQEAWEKSNWNHAASTVIRYAPYNSGPGRPRNPKRPQIDVSRGPGPTSRLCLGCHDGTVAVNSYGSITGNVMIEEPYKIGAGGVLSNHHPIGFSFGEVSDKEISRGASLGSHSIDDLLSDGRMECTTCHDVHNKGNSGEKLLWVSDRNSNLCCSCHKLCNK